MSDALDRRRRRLLFGIGAAAGGGVLAGGLSLIPPPGPPGRREQGQLVFPDFAARMDALSLVMVTTAEEAYHLTRDPSGWVMPEKDLHPVRPERLRALASALASLRFDRAMTRDDRKFDRIGLGDPLSGGTGALVEAGDGSGGVFAKAIIGYRDGRSYVRFPDDLQAWSVTGEPAPPLQRAVRWLDLSLVDVAADPIRELVVTVGREPPYTLVQANGVFGRAGAPPPVSPVEAMALAGPGLALARWSPVDVARRGGQGGALAGRYLARLASGIEIVLVFQLRNGAGWVEASASAPTGPAASGDAAARADAINARVGDWRYRLTDADWSAFLAPTSTLR
jgi:hypothetical protein